MADTPEDFTKEIIAGTVSETTAKVLDAALTKSLLGPASVEIGALLGDLTSAIRFYASDNLGRICHRWAETRQNEPLLEAEVRNVMPLLQIASMESDSDMQERWARLLQSVASGSNATLPSFGQCLSQMTNREARFLEHLWNERRGEIHEGQDLWWMVKEYTSLFQGGLVMPNGRIPHAEKMDLQDECEEVLTDLTRLAVIQMKTKAIKRTNALRNSSSWLANNASKYVGDHELIDFFELSPYGYKFLRAIARA